MLVSYKMTISSYGIMQLTATISFNYHVLEKYSYELSHNQASDKLILSELKCGGKN